MMDFPFRRVRFHFTALDGLRLPSGAAANAIRGAFGAALHRTAPPGEYERLFKRRLTAGPSGLADPPRPFVFRCAHLEGLDAAPGSAFAFDVHFFDLSAAACAHFERAFRAWETPGLGASGARLRLERAEIFAPASLSLEPDGEPAGSAAVRFLTPTELKHDGRIALRPEFPILFGRIRDRIATLCALFGNRPLSLDFAGLGERAAAVRMARCEIEWVRRERRSGASGQVHPLGGFIGEAEYAGELSEFLPWLRAAEVAGVGRQTAWGKGELRLMPPLG
jgi:hypothetical protein